MCHEVWRQALFEVIHQIKERHLGCLNRPSAIDRFLDSSRHSRFSYIRWPNIFNHTRGLLGHPMRPLLIFTTR